MSDDSGLITPAELTATADNKNKTYGDTNPVLTISYTGLVNEENASVITEPSISTTAETSSIHDTYPITLTGGSAVNYTVTLVSGTMTVDKAILSITADNKSKIYGSINPDLTVTYSGFVLGENQSVLDALPVVQTDAVQISDAGEYDITASGAADGNYSFVYNKGTLVIEKADQIITFETIPDGLRISEEHLLVAEATSNLPVTFETSDQNIGSLNDNKLTINKEGNLTITASQSGNHNWNPATPIDQSIVTKVTFDNITSLFTPNNDGMNDYWYIPNLIEFGTVHVTVYNRFGQAVYKSDSYNNDWDGTWNGNPLPSASYYYIMKTTEKGIVKGIVNIVR